MCADIQNTNCQVIYQSTTVLQLADCQRWEVLACVVVARYSQRVGLLRCAVTDDSRLLAAGDSGQRLPHRIRHHGEMHFQLAADSRSHCVLVTARARV